MQILPLKTEIRLNHGPFHVKTQKIALTVDNQRQKTFISKILKPCHNKRKNE
jgi:hypothetical protein